MDMEQHLRVERRGQVMWLIIDREQRRNALDRATIEAMRLALVAAEADPVIHAVVLTGVGDRLGTLLSQILDKSPAAIRRGLYTLKQFEAMPFEQSAAFAESQIALMALTDDAREGQQAFRDRRRPLWSGR